MQVNRKAARGERAPVEIPLGRGAVLTARPLDSFEHKLVLAEARADLTALLAGEATARHWASITPDRIADAKAHSESEHALLTWMHGVLLAAKAGVALKGVDEIGEDGEVIGPLEASFETFELLFADVAAESRFKLHAYRLEQIWSAEKNVSGPGPNGSGPGASNTATPAGTQETPAPAAASDIPAGPSPSSESDARSAPARPEPLKANSPGASPEAAAPGASPA